MRKNFDYKVENNSFKIEKFSKYINTHNCPVLTMDLSDLNIFDTLKFMVLCSACHYKKYPEGKLKCYICSDDIKSFISTFTTGNLELV